MRMWSHLGLCLALGSCAFEAELDGTPTIAFEFAMSGADEASTVVMIPVVLSRDATLEVSVDYAVLAGGNAIAGADFSVGSGTLVFQPGEQTKFIPVTINADSDEMEMAETFQLALATPKNARLDEERAIHSVRIADHILPRVSVGPGFTTASEASPSMLLVKLDRPAEGASTVTIGVSPGGPAAATDADYAITDNTVVTFAKGETMKLVSIGEKNDALDEEDEEVVVFTLRGASEDLVLGVSKTMDHRITDDDAPPALTLNATASINEPNLLHTLTLSLDKPSGRTVRVDYIRDGNDTADSDDATVIGSPGTLTYDPGETSKTILVPITNDSIDEDDETVLINLSNAVNVMLGTATHALTIVDNDTATVSFQSATSSVDEDDAGGISIVVRLATASAQQVTVPFSVAGGTTAEMSDYDILTASPLVFPPGVTQLAIDIDVPETTGNEGTERLVLELGTPTGAPRGSPSQHTLSILE